MLQDESTRESTKESGTRSTLRDLTDLASAWSSPMELFRRLKQLITERPLVGFAASVVLGMVLAGRLRRRAVR